MFVVPRFIAKQPDYRMCAYFTLNVS